MTPRPEQYAPTDTEVLDALRFYEQKRGPATTRQVEITLAAIKKQRYTDDPQTRSSPLGPGCVLRHLQGLVERGLVAEVNGAWANEKTWCTTERHAELLAAQERERAEKAERRRVLRAALGALEANGVQGRIDSPSGVSVPLGGLQRLLAAAGWVAVDMEHDEIGAAMVREVG